VIVALVLALQTPASTLDSTIISAVRAVAEHEPVEAFGKRVGPGFVPVREIVLLDADGDGAPEAFVWIVPRFRQTPTLLVYGYDQQHGVRRLLEGLVPGSPQPISGHLVDDHTLGFGIDLGFNSVKPLSIEFLATDGIKNHMSVVRYRTFAHVDGRSSFVTIVDLSNWKLPPDTKTCEQFEFSSVEALAAGTLAGSGQRYLVALTNGDITVYRFRGVRPNGLFDKESWLRPRPSDVVGLAVSPDGAVEVRTRDGQLAPLSKP
jgi:hypothetical protein